ncbi:MAG: C69 family dipeptidase [Clostridia bacterium]
MKKNAKLLALVLVTVLMLMSVQSALACTIISVGTEATTDGSTITTHNDDSTSADFRLWITPSMEGGEGKMRDIVIDSHNYGDFANYPEVKDYGNGMLAGETPQPENTIPYFHSRYSFINQKGVAMGEATFSIDTETEYGKKVQDLIYTNNDGLIDCWNAQDIALERATTAKEAAQIMGSLVEEFGWRDSGETINIVDGKEIWIAEFYGRDLWCAVRLPSNAFFVAANRARIDEFKFDDPDNFICSPNFKSFAVDNGLWKEEDGVFNPAEIYAPDNGRYSTRREWRAFDLVAPSLKLDPEADRFPLYVVPEKKLSVQDIFEIKGDYYNGTDYDLSLAPEAGPFGNPIGYNNIERPINMFRTCYVMIANIKADLPDEMKCLVWYGYGAPDTTYLTPLWPSMNELPDLYSIGNRYEAFDRNSGWWTNSYVQQVATINYQSAVKEIHAAREEKMNAQYEIVPMIQEVGAKLIAEGKVAEAKDLITTYACNNAIDWHQKWLALGDDLMGTYMWGKVDMAKGGYSDWWKAAMAATPRNPGFVEEEAAK